MGFKLSKNIRKSIDNNGKESNRWIGELLLNNKIISTTSDYDSPSGAEWIIDNQLIKDLQKSISIFYFKNELNN